MRFIGTELQGVFVIEPELFIDSRGVFRRNFDVKDFDSVGIDSKVINANISENPHKYTLRGFHYQTGNSAEGKTLSCLNGSIYDIVVDLRPDSTTYLKWEAFELNSKNRLSLHVPRGCANAFLTTTRNTLVHYYVSNSYNPKLEKGIRFNDPLFNFSWPNKPSLISEKDLTHPDFEIK